MYLIQHCGKTALSLLGFIQRIVQQTTGRFCVCLFIFPIEVEQLNFNFMSSVAVIIVTGHCLLYRFLSVIYARKFLILVLQTGPLYHDQCRQAD